MVKAFGDEFLARPPFADDKHGAIERRGAACALHRIEKGEALANELFGSLHAPTVGGKSHHLARIFPGFSPGKLRILLKNVLSSILARLLYG